MRLDLGSVGENLATVHEIDMREWIDEYPNGVITAAVHRPGESTPYPVSVLVKEGILQWVVTMEDVALAGMGGLELVMREPLDDGGWKVDRSQVIRLIIHADMANQDDLDMEAMPPEAGTWLDSIQEAEASTKVAAANAAQEAANATEESIRLDMMGYMTAAQDAAATSEQIAAGFTSIQDTGVDSSRTILGAAADAQATGIRILRSYEASRLNVEENPEDESHIIMHYKGTEDVEANTAELVGSLSRTVDAMAIGARAENGVLRINLTKGGNS